MDIVLSVVQPGRNGNPKRSANRGPKLDETMVKMIVTAYEEKQKELMAENEDLQEALNGIRVCVTSMSCCCCYGVCDGMVVFTERVHGFDECANGEG